MFLTDNSHPIVTHGSHVFRAPPHQNPPRFSTSPWYIKFTCHFPWYTSPNRPFPLISSRVISREMVLWAKPHGPAPDPLFSVISNGNNDVVVFGVRFSNYHNFMKVFKIFFLPDPCSARFSGRNLGSRKVLGSPGILTDLLLLIRISTKEIPRMIKNNTPVQQEIITRKMIEFFSGAFSDFKVIRLQFVELQQDLVRSSQA